MVASCEVLPLVALVPKAGVTSPRNPVVGRQWSRSLGLVEKEGESENLGIVVSLVGALGGSSTGGRTTWILGGCWSRGGWSWIVCGGSC